MEKIKKQKFSAALLFFALLTVLFLPLLAKADTATEGRALEVVYPQIPGDVTPVPVTTGTGLLNYINYIFKLSLFLVGFIIFGSLIYGGFLYFTSAGRTERFSEAKDRIFSSILGAAILLAAYLIFNTINPQLVILNAPPLSVTEPIVYPGVYICTYNASDKVYPAIKDYMSDDINKKTAGTEAIKGVIQNSNGSCSKINNSLNLTDPITKSNKRTIFVIPEKKTVYNPDNGSGTSQWVYDYGIILHQTKNFLGQCKIAAVFDSWITDNKIASKTDINDQLKNLTFTFDEIKSITLFTRPETEPTMENTGVSLYKCLNYGENGMCPTGVSTDNGQPFYMSAGDYFRPVEKNELSDDGLMSKLFVGTFQDYGNERSVSIDPPNSYFAVMFSGSDFKGDVATGLGQCEVISESVPNLFALPIGQCGPSCKITTSGANQTSYEEQMARCMPCAQSMAVIKGQALYGK